MAKRNQKNKRDIYQEVTDKIIGYLEQGTVPWRKPIKGVGGSGFPRNLQSGKNYRGINVLLLGVRAFESGFGSSYWLTFKQTKELGGQVRKGERGSLVTFWKLYATTDRASGDEIEVPVLKHYTVFNLGQIDGIESPDTMSDAAETEAFEPLRHAEAIVARYTDGPSLHHDGGHRAFYRPRTDSVHMPRPEDFNDRETYYGTLFHELSHSTAHSSRLDRGIDTEPAPFGSPDYSREELIAELSASFLCAAAGISPPTIEQSAAYLQSWITVLKGDARLIVNAAGAAQKSADRILGQTFEDAAKSKTGQPEIDSSKSEPAKSQQDHNLLQLGLF
ncbi:zincin-like metallopeptidase domain-containing protein [Stieleria sp. TO1_6]|uniref:ArdC family protein n=1 Tax=Stieleria tagensis TaxID=2956795 RepID=UPI00209AE7EB|nr:zincin-like metallopeptidase domain-containing protein [Stieleria tagensis]MCO8122889.1 zincin-like metallopeptidase domain-containing protein [Stieleria tagensis]